MNKFIQAGIIFGIGWLIIEWLIGGLRHTPITELTLQDIGNIIGAAIIGFVVYHMIHGALAR